MTPPAFRTHDLLRVQPEASLLSFCDSAEAGAGFASLEDTPWVVVRRAAVSVGVPVGVRGKTRAERFAAWLSPQAVLECVAPPQLCNVEPLRDLPALRALRELAERWASLPYAWGPTGSVGFELASGAPVAHAGSDLDLVVYTDVALTAGEAKDLLADAGRLAAAADVQLEMPLGSFSLVEFVRSPECCMLRTAEGPRLVNAASVGLAR